jgi:selenocysteine lyase/cysteine desulfurase
MPLDCQKHLFSLEENVHYLNCSYMSPLLKSVEAAGVEGVLQKRNPFRIPPAGFFSGAAELKPLFAQLVGGTADRVALIPSVAYGMGLVARNLKGPRGGQIVTVHEDFPSNVYPWQRVAQEKDLTIQVVTPPDVSRQRGFQWNEKILSAIMPGTAMVAVPHVHWADGTRFDLEAIGHRAKEVGAILVVDGTQSVGALPIDVRRYRIDALVCGSYKWLMGPYSLGVAYLGEYFDDGIPLEESWMNRLDSDNFQRLVAYEPQYRPGAARYDVGEHSNFILLPMLTAALRQILAWEPAQIQAYCRQLTAPLVAYLAAHGYWTEDAGWRGEHLVGVRLPAGIDLATLQERLAAHRVLVSVRGDSIRVSPHLYNDKRDIAALLDVLASLER